MGLVLSGRYLEQLLDQRAAQDLGRTSRENWPTILYLTMLSHFSFWENAGHRSNNQVELLTLFYLIKLANKKGILNIKLFCDSMLVINFL